MYCEEMEHWLAEERLEEARSQVRFYVKQSVEKWLRTQKQKINELRSKRAQKLSSVC